MSLASLVSLDKKWSLFIRSVLDIPHNLCPSVSASIIEIYWKRIVETVDRNDWIHFVQLKINHDTFPAELRPSIEVLLQKITIVN